MTVDESIEAVTEDVRAMLDGIGMEVMTEGLTLSQLIREGHSVAPGQSIGWADEHGAICALAGAEAALRARR